MQSAMTRWDPFRSLASLPNFLTRTGSLADFLGGNDRGEVLTGSWVPPVDIAEEADRIVLTAELPGFREDQVEIQLDNGVLTLRGEREFEKKDDQRNYHRVERSYGHFVRSFTLPNAVDANAVAARFEDGLLRIELPKRQEAKPRQIKISGSGDSKKSIGAKS